MNLQACRFLVLPWYFALAFLFTGSPDCAAVERTFSAENFGITVPDGWEDVTNEIPQKKAKIIVAYGKPDKSALLFVGRDEIRHKLPLDDLFARDFSGGVAQGSKGKHISGRFLQQAGIKCYEDLSELSVGGKKMSSALRVIPIADGAYQLTGMAMEAGPATEHQELQAAMNSFRFLDGPAPEPVVAQASSVYLKQSAAYSAGYKAGRTIGALVVLALVVAIPVGIILLVVKFARGSGKKRRSHHPPPIPR